MPRLKPSPGVRRFHSPVMPELQRLVFFELVNATNWNPTTMKLEPLAGSRWRFKTVTVTIEYDGAQTLTITTTEPRWSPRQGFTFDMGSGRIIIEATTRGDLA